MDICWLVGFFEGECSFGIGVRWKSGTSFLSLQPKIHIAIVDSDLCLMRRINAFLHVKCDVITSFSSLWHSSWGDKSQGQHIIAVQAIDSCDRFLRIIIPHMESKKKKEALALLAIVSIAKQYGCSSLNNRKYFMKMIRLSEMITANRASKNKKYTYDYIGSILDVNGCVLSEL